MSRREDGAPAGGAGSRGSPGGGPRGWLLWAGVAAAVLLVGTGIATRAVPLFALVLLVIVWRSRIIARIWNSRPLRPVRWITCQVRRAFTAAFEFILPPAFRARAGRVLGASFVPFFALWTATAIVWLVAGLVPALVALSEPLHEAFHDWGDGSGFFADIARDIADISHGSENGIQTTLDYMFSALNIGLGIFLVIRGPRHRAARLLAVAMIGTAVAFNLQSHLAPHVIPGGREGAVGLWHNTTHVLSGVCYMFALLLFPDGRLASRRRAPYLLFVALAFSLLSLITITEHTTGLVIVFGVFIPIAAVSSQLRRYRTASAPEARQQSRLLLWAMALALGGTLVVVGVTSAFSSSTRLSQKTWDYELTAPASGTYFFVCDPHLWMKGTIEVVASDQLGRSPPDVVDITSEGSEFDKSSFRLPSGKNVIIRFTNKDGDLHNVSIYRESGTGDAPPEQPVFIGELFSGDNLAAFAFRTFRIVFALIPITLFIGLLRFRLWDMDKVLNRTLVYGALAGFITAVYVGVVVGVSTLLGAARERNLLIAIGATAIVAVAFEPVREQLQRLANRIVYGRRATPYEILSHFSERFAGTYTSGEVLPRMARVLAEATGAARADVWMLVDSRITPVASWPAEAGEALEAAVVKHERLPPLPGVNRAVEVRHQGELLGALTIATRPGEPLSPLEDGLLKDLASQAGLILRNVGLTAELQARVREISGQAAELRASRQRIVAAQDAQRRRLERDIHDGAQQHLVALAVKLRLARRLTERDPSRGRRMVTELRGEVARTVETLRELAGGIYPPLLADEGLSSALRLQCQRSGLPVVVESDGVGRYAAEVEGAVYFSCLEALQNVAKYAQASRVVVRLEEKAETLTFEVRDDGVGFDTKAVGPGLGIQNMIDRIAAVGGTLEVQSTRGRGTQVIGRVPVRVQEPVA